MSSIGKILIVVGSLLVVAGVLLVLHPRMPHLGRLPGDIVIKKENFVFYLPLTTSLIVSVILSVIFWILKK